MKMRIVLLSLVLFIGCASQPSFIRTFENAEVVPGLAVGVTPDGPTFMVVHIHNYTDGTVRLLWDESAYVNTLGQSSRLVRAKTRLIHASQEQPPSPIPPGAQLKESFLPEFHIDEVQYNYRPYVGDLSKPAHLYFAFDVGGQKRTWHTLVRHEEQP